MSLDPYAPPRAELVRAAFDHDLPRSIRWMVFGGIGAAAITCAINVVGMLNSVWTLRNLGARPPGVYLAYDLCHVFVVAGLAYGTYRGSRTCAVLALVTSVLAHTIGLLLSRGALAIAWALGLAIIAGYVFGAIGTLQWHSWRAAQRRVIS